MSGAVVQLHPEAPAPAAVDSIVRLPALLTRVSLSTATIYRRMASGEFPRSQSLGGKSVGWRESDISAWIAGTWQAPA